MASLKNLAGETVIYGLSSMLGKFLNWLLVPLYTFVLTSSADYGIVTNLYAWTAFLLVILTYGMETGFFRFVNKETNGEKIGNQLVPAMEVYGNTLLQVGFTSLLAAIGFILLSPQIAHWLGYDAHPEFVRMLGIVVCMDAFDCIPFAYLRHKRKAAKFAILKFATILVNIVMNLFFLIGCPWLMEHAPSAVEWFYNPNYGVGYVFISNLISTIFVTLALIPDICEAKLKLNFTLLRQMLGYSLPLLILGIAGIMNQTVDKILFPFLYKAGNAQAELGIYGACFKIAMVMMMFTQAFRYAYEPFVFSKHKDKDSVATYADAMKYFVIFSLLILLGMIFYLPVLKHLVNRTYWEGMRVVPIVLWSYVFQGIYFNLSLWYKLTDKTYFGAIFSIIGCIITFAFNIAFVPTMSYMASAWASFVCYAIIMLISYIVGQKHLPIPYDLKNMGLYTLLTLLLLGCSGVFAYYISSTIIQLVFNTILLVVYLVILVKKDFPLSEIPVIGKKFKKNR